MAAETFTFVYDSVNRMRDVDGHLVDIMHVRICLNCGKSTGVHFPNHPGAAPSCPYCAAVEHTATMIVVTTKIINGRPVITVSNFGNHEGP